ncbi:glycoside hydrolase superfamily, partial [Echria macrotheca]
FNPRSSQNIAVYFGQSPATTRTSLADQCADPNIDIVILGFLTSLRYNNTAGAFPRLELSAACPSLQTEVMQTLAPGLAYYPQLEADILRCQGRYGKKILLSLGGAGSGEGLGIGSDEEAGGVADVLWGLFGPPGVVDEGLRPFGGAVVDGFDLDKSDGLPDHWDTVATALRTKFATDTSKDYFLSAAPQCLFPDASIPLGWLVQSNFVWPQFFNNQKCDLTSPSLPDALSQWSRILASSIVPLSDASPFRTRLYVGVPSWPDAAPSSYAAAFGTGWRGVVSFARQIRLFLSEGGGGGTNLGGMMFWDGPEGGENVLGGLSILGWAKRGLVSG